MDLASRYDVVILGGGPAGFAAALSLRSSPDLRILVVEAQAPGQQRIGESCPPDVMVPLARLGLAAEFKDAGHAPCPGFASSWGRPGVGYNDFIVNPLGPGWRLDRKAFDRMLAEAATARGVDVAWRTRFRGVEPAAEPGLGHRLHFARTGPATCSIDAAFVIDATGSQAHFARALGIARQIDDKLFARVRFARIAAGDLETEQVMLEATPQGWWYAAALPGNGVVAMMVGEADAVRALGRSDAGYDRILNATSFVGPALATLRLDCMSYRTLPIRSGILGRLEGTDWLAVGDAAASYDPVMAQGIYKALTDGIAGGQAIAAHLEGRGSMDGSYAQRIRDRYRAYLQSRAHLYGLEQRWPESPFWRNRHAIRQGQD
ncbi:MAG: FAD-dependent monooxygenase [Rhodobacter sp.]|nr:FAD-dependent monooxygenase [Rhodobacter sp.]